MRYVVIALAAALSAAPASAQELERPSEVRPDDFSPGDIFTEADSGFSALAKRAEAARSQTADAITHLRAGEESGIVIFSPASSFGFELTQIAEDAAVLSRRVADADPKRGEALARVSDSLNQAARTRPIGPDIEVRQAWLAEVNGALDSVLILRKRPSR